jgi:hypothetical protein
MLINKKQFFQKTLKNLLILQFYSIIILKNETERSL